jgi:hypothetical protein
MFLGCSPCCNSCPINVDRLRLEFDGWADQCSLSLLFGRRRLWSADNGGSITLFRNCTFIGVPLCTWSGWIHRTPDGIYYTWTLDATKGTLSFDDLVTFLPPGDSLSLACTVNNAAAGRLAVENAAGVQPGMWVQRVPVGGQYLFAADTKVAAVDGNVITLSSPLLSPTAGAAAFLSPVTFLLPDEGAFGRLPFQDERPLLVASVADNVPVQWCDAVTVAISVGTGDYVPVTVAPTCPNIVRPGVDQVAAVSGGQLYAKGHCSVHDDFAGEVVGLGGTGVGTYSDDPVSIAVDFSTSAVVHEAGNFSRPVFDPFQGLKLLNGTYELRPDIVVLDRHFSHPSFIGTDPQVEGFGYSLSLQYGFAPGLYRYIDEGTGEEFFFPVPATPPPYDNVGTIMVCSAELFVSVWPELAKAERTLQFISAMGGNGDQVDLQQVVSVCQAGEADEIAWHWSYRFRALTEPLALGRPSGGGRASRRGSTDFVQRTCAAPSFDDSIEFDWYWSPAAGGSTQVDKVTVALSLTIG